MSESPLSELTVSCSGRSRVIDAAERLFRARGYSNVTMRDIAKEVGIRQASLYYHFESKEQLYVAVTELEFEHHHKGLQHAIEQQDNLRAQLDCVAKWFLCQPPVHLLSMLHTDMPCLSEENLKKLSESSHRCIFVPIQQMFEQAQKRGEIRQTRPNVLAGFFLSVMESIPLVITGETMAPKQAVVNEMIDVLFNGLKP
ncbi:MAG: TetR/AcrR family transcriptional regulator [Calothrix sp. C42_A2020_038]|nr:TetR/AcrR family transcriptional regulator [Calothrix sp. C42_A2020_038]